MLGENIWNHLTLAQVKLWIFSQIAVQTQACPTWIKFSVNTKEELAHGNGQAHALNRCSALDGPLPEKSCGHQAD